MNVNGSEELASFFFTSALKVEGDSRFLQNVGSYK
jgi:hypothetical protein